MICKRTAANELSPGRISLKKRHENKVFKTLPLTQVETHAFNSRELMGSRKDVVQ
jgi:hypothetical protein